jgi:hypothetical protein
MNKSISEKLRLRRIAAIAAIVLGACGGEISPADTDELATDARGLLTTYAQLGFTPTSVDTGHQYKAIDVPGIVAVVGAPTMNDADTAAIRMRNPQAGRFEVQMEEESSRDGEVTHAQERLFLFAATNSVLRDRSGAVIGRAGSFSAGQSARGSWRRISFPQSIRDPVVFAQVMSRNDGAPLTTRIRNVSSSGFDFRMDEWDYLNGVHGTELVGWVAVSSGEHVIRSTSVTSAEFLVASKHQVDHRSTRVLVAASNPYIRVFNLTWPLAAQVQTVNDASPVAPRMDTYGSSLLQEQEASDGRHALETVGFLGYRIKQAY